MAWFMELTLESSNLGLQNTDSGTFPNLTSLSLSFLINKVELVETLPSCGCYVCVGGIKPLIYTWCAVNSQQVLDAIITTIIIIK